MATQTRNKTIVQDETLSSGRGITQERGGVSNLLAQFTTKAVSNLLKTWQGVKGSAQMAIGARMVRPDLPDEDLAYIEKQITACLEPKGGEVTARANTVELGKLYLSLNEEGRVRFFNVLAQTCDVDSVELAKRAEAITKLSHSKDRWVAEQALREALISPRTVLFRQFSALPDGFKFLVDMRAELLAAAERNPQLGGVENDLKQVLTAWFDIGLLDLEEITWRSPAALLEKLMVYEAVHAIRSWEDLKNRMDADRRVFAFFHNKMPLEPLIFVQVAFTQGLANSIQDVLDEKKPVFDIALADTAIFYSISNAQKGLAGISFGNFLIKRVVDKLSREFPQLHTFATLSPVPGFRTWLDGQLSMGDDDKLFMPFETHSLCMTTGEKSAADGLKKLLASAWHENTETKDMLKPLLMRLLTQYLVREKRGGKRALDPVAHFHLSNGARLEQVNWLGDISAKGFKQSAGMMVNYHYKLSDIDDNHEHYVTEGFVSASRQVQGLLK